MDIVSLLIQLRKNKLEDMNHVMLIAIIMYQPLIKGKKYGSHLMMLMATNRSLTGKLVHRYNRSIEHITNLHDQPSTSYSLPN